MDNNEKKPGQPQQGGKGSNDDSKQPQQQQGDKSKQPGEDKSRQNK